MKQTSLVATPPLLVFLAVLGTLGYTYVFASVDLTLPIYPGAEQMEMYTSSSTSGYFYYFKTSNQADAVMAFYKNALPASILYRQAPQLAGLSSAGAFTDPTDMPSSLTYAPYEIEFRCYPSAHFEETIQTLRGDYRISFTAKRTKSDATYFEISVWPLSDYYVWSCDHS